MLVGLDSFLGDEMIKLDIEITLKGDGKGNIDLNVEAFKKQVFPTEDETKSSDAILKRMKSIFDQIANACKVDGK